MPLRRGDDASYTLLSNGSATGSAFSVKGGEYLFSVEGTVSGATISLQFQSPNGTWADVQPYGGTAVKATALPYCATMVALPAGAVRVAISGGPPSAVYAYLVGLG
jgi:hypothetical protein